MNMHVLLDSGGNWNICRNSTETWGEHVKLTQLDPRPDWESNSDLLLGGCGAIYQAIVSPMANFNQILKIKTK